MAEMINTALIVNLAMLTLGLELHAISVAAASLESFQDQSSINKLSELLDLFVRALDNTVSELYR